MQDDEIAKKIEQLQRRHAAATRDKANEAGRLAAWKDELAAIVAEITEAGFDPKTIVAERNQVRTELEGALAEFESKLVQVEEALAALRTGS